MNRCTAPPLTEDSIAPPLPSTGSAMLNLYRCLQSTTDRIVQQSVDTLCPFNSTTTVVLLTSVKGPLAIPVITNTAKETLKSQSLRLKSSIKQFWNAYLEQIFGNKNYQNHNEWCPFRYGALTQLSNHGFRKRTNFSSFVQRSLF